jgi:SAM-dependent methyltransferase
MGADGRPRSESPGPVFGPGGRLCQIPPELSGGADSLPPRGRGAGAFGGRPDFISLKGTAESTGLRDRSVSLITCAQAFHWFDPLRAAAEFRRILSPGGSCAIVWNTALPEASEFAIGYERIKVRFGTDFGRIRHESIQTPARFDGFFGPGNWRKRSFPNHQVLDFEGLSGRLRSSSYAPKEGDPRHGPMMSALRDLFDHCQRSGLVRMDYETEVYLGRFEGIAPGSREQHPA